MKDKAPRTFGMNRGAVTLTAALAGICFITLFLDQTGNPATRNVGCFETWERRSANLRVLGRRVSPPGIGSQVSAEC